MIKDFLKRLRSRRVIAVFASVIAFLAALITLWSPVKNLLWLTEFNVYVLHPESLAAGSAWGEFGQGVEDFLSENGARLESSPLRVGDYKLSFRRRTWQDESELPQQLEAIASDRRALAVISATNSQTSETILNALPAADRPLILLATATKGNLVRETDEDGISQAARGVFRLVAPNEKQAFRLAATIITPNFSECGRRDRTDNSVTVAILREETSNASFTRDLVSELRDYLATAPNVEVVVDAVADTNLTISTELIQLQPDFLVYVGSQRQALVVHNQIRRIHSNLDIRGCLPTLLLTDAGVIGNGEGSYPANENLRFATLPFARKGRFEEESSLGFRSLGRDSADLIFQAARNVTQGSEKLGRIGLIREMGLLREFEGEALDYQFENGENVLADFHLWAVASGSWHHWGNCRSEEHSPVDIPPPVNVQTLPANDANFEAVRIGAKPFTEQLILAELAVKALNDAGISAVRGPNSLNAIRDLLRLDRIDGYWEYTGTALHLYNQPRLRGAKALQKLRELEKGEIVWLEPLPVNNSFVLVAKRTFTDQHGISTIRDLARFVNQGGDVRLCANSEWFDIELGLPGLQRAYDFTWPEELRRSIPLEIRYEAFEERCEVMVAFTTDARLQEISGRLLVDNQNFFAESKPTLNIRADIHQMLKKEMASQWTAFHERLECIGEHLDSEKMRHLNSQVEEDRRFPEDVAHEFLLQHCPRATYAPERT